MGFFDTIGNAVKSAANFIGRKMVEGADFIGQKVIPAIPGIPAILDTVTSVVDKASPFLKYLPGGGAIQDVVSTVNSGLKGLNSYIKTNASNDLERIKNIAKVGGQILR